MKPSELKSSRRLRAGVVGLGRIGWDFHCHQLSTSELFELVAACDTSPDRRAEATKLFGARAHATLEEMLQKQDLDVVVIASPTHLHREAALSALEAGCHVIVEKPVALNLAEAQEIFTLAHDRNLAATTYQPLRCTAAHRRLATALSAGELGSIHAVRRCMHSFTRRDDWQSLTRFGGGSLMNAGAHLIDQAVALWGRDLRVTAAKFRRIFTLGDAEDFFHITLENPDRLNIQLEVNPACLDVAADSAFAVYGSAGNYFQQGEVNRFIRLDEGALAPRVLKQGLLAAGRQYPSEVPPILTETITEPQWRNDNPLFYRNFHGAVTAGEILITQPHDTLAVMRLIEEARRVADAGR